MPPRNRRPIAGPPCGRVHRRSFLADLGFGFTGLVLGSMLNQDGISRAAEGPATASRSAPGPHFAPKAKNVIWIFLSGGVSQMETWDPKPALNRFAGKTYAETPFPDPFANPLFRERSRAVVGEDRTHSEIFPMQVGHRRFGKSGIELTDWWPELGSCADDIAFVRSMYSTDNDHAAEFQFHHGRHKLDPKEPCIGSWIHYGLGTLNENLPQFVFLGKYSDMRVRENFNPDYLGPTHAGVELSLDPGAPLPFGSPAGGVLAEEQREQFAFIRDLNALSGVEYPDDEQLSARIKAYELAYRMQASVPEALDLGAEDPETERLYGIDRDETAVYGRRLLTARRLVERGSRFALVYLSDYGEWDSHTKLRDFHSLSCSRVDRPLAGLLKDLKRRGLDSETTVVCCTEFGRTPGLEVRDGYVKPDGRDHHPHAFTIWFAGAGIKKGIVHGATDELGFHVTEDAHYVTDVHATLLHLLGLDSRRLEIPGRKRLDVDHGKPIAGILA